MDNQEKINQLISSFVESERVQGWTSSTRRRNLTIKEEKQLDTLARLLTNKEKPQDTCVALFLKNNGELLIASNLDEPKYARSYLEDLKEFIEVSSKESHDETYKKLIKRAVKQTLSFIIMSDERGKKTISDLTNLAKFKSAMEKTENLEVIQNLSKEVFQEFQKKKIKGWYWEYLLPLNDINIIANDIRDEKFDPKIIKAIRERRICYIKDKLNMHAEMKILNKLYDEKSQSFLEVGYIGITKLCCAPCQTMIDLVNSKMRDNFLTCGTHGATYLGWIMPDFYQEELIESLEREKKWESSSEIPQTLSRNLYGEFQREWISIHPSFRDKETKDSWSKYFAWSELKDWFELTTLLKPEQDLEFVLWMRDEQKLDITKVLTYDRLARWRTNYQQAKLRQGFQTHIQIPPK